MSFDSSAVAPANLSDFFVFSSAARFVWDGGAAAALYDPGAFKAFQIGLGAAPGGLHPFNYPPTYIFAILPFGSLPYASAWLSWLAVTLLLFILAARCAGLRAAEVTALVVAPAAMVNISAGQNGFLTSALLVAGLFLLERRPLVAGCLFGLLTFKPQLGLLIPVALLAQRRWRVILVAALSAGLLLCASLAAFGPSSWAAYVDFLETFRRMVEIQAENAFASNSATVLMGARIAGLPAPAAYLLQSVASVAVAVTVYALYRTTRDRTLQHAALLTGTILVTPFGFLYDLPFLSLAIILLVRHGLREGFLPYERIVLASGWLMPFMGSQMNELGLPVTPVIEVALFGLVLVRARSPHAARPPLPEIASRLRDLTVRRILQRSVRHD